MAGSASASTRAGSYVAQSTGYRAFIPAPLPPVPAVDLSGELQGQLSAADRALGIFAASASELGVHAGSYFSSLDASFRMVRLTVEASPESDLARAARALAGQRHTAILYGEDHGRVIPCKQNVCFEPIQRPADLQTIPE